MEMDKKVSIHPNFGLLPRQADNERYPPGYRSGWWEPSRPLSPACPVAMARRQPLHPVVLILSHPPSFTSVLRMRSLVLSVGGTRVDGLPLGSPGLAPATETAAVPFWRASGCRAARRRSAAGSAAAAASISSPSGAVFLRGIDISSLFLLCSPALGGAVTTEAEPSLRSTSP
jgi:hypothetical protein